MTEQLALTGTAGRRRHGYMRGRVEARLVELRREGRALDLLRASLWRDYADAVDRERARLRDVPDASTGTLGRMLGELSELVDRWDTASTLLDEVADLLDHVDESDPVRLDDE